MSKSTLRTLCDGLAGASHGPLARPPHRPAGRRTPLLLRPMRAALLCMILSAAGIRAAFAGYHEKGNVIVSSGGSLAHSFNYRKQSLIEYEWDGERLREIESSNDESYDQVDLMLSLSYGQFIADRLEIGISGSALESWYSATNRDSYAVYDAKLYAKLYFDRPDSGITPYVKAEGGASWIKTGDYTETDAILGTGVGLEVYGMGSMTWFAEFSSEYTFISGSLQGTEWHNRLYVGVSWHLNLTKKGAAPAAGATPVGQDATTLRLIERTEERYRRALNELDEEIEKGLRSPSPSATKP